MAERRTARRVVFIMITGALFTVADDLGDFPVPFEVLSL